MRLPASASIVVLTGAGISAESGIPTFRDGGGLWETYPVQQVATPQAFEEDPALVHRFYDARRRQLREVAPNAAHLALARLERAWPGGVRVVTQNVDDLHGRAGTRDLVHLHGELRKVRCAACREVHPWEGDCPPKVQCPACRRPRLRPHVVWFGEAPLDMDRVRESLARCGLFVAVGTSGSVWPAAGLVDLANPFAYTLELNLEPSEVSAAFFEQRLGKATELVPALVEELLAGLPSAPA